MKVREVKDFFRDKENVPCSLMERLISAGYRQKSGYIDIAKKKGISNPSQYWHLMNYCDMVDGEKTFGRNVVCGELVFWMAEVSSAVGKDELEDLLERIIYSGEIDNRKKWNREIQRVCLEGIKELINNEDIKKDSCMKTG